MQRTASVVIPMIGALEANLERSLAKGTSAGPHLAAAAGGLVDWAVVSDEAAARKRQGVREHYATDENLRRRQSLFTYVRPSALPQPQFHDLFDWPPDARVLDLGCGNGLWTSVALTRTPRGAVVAFDRSAGMLDAVAGSAPHALRTLGDGHALPFADASFDVVIAAWVLYHLDDKPRALAEIGRVLRPDGRLLAATNSADAFPGLDALVHESVEATVGRHITRWIEALDFTLENGAGILATRFADVERVDNTTGFAVTDAEAIVALVESVSGPIQEEVGEPLDIDRLLDEVRGRAQALLADGPIEFSRRAAFFTATGFTPG